MKKSLAFILLFVSFAISVAAQHLEKKISINVTSKPLTETLNEISKQGGFVFSYNSDLIAPNKLVTIRANNKTVQQVLEQLLGNAFEYREKKNHVIIQLASEWEVTGYVMDKKTGEKLSNVSVYEPQRLTASLTDDEGYFSLKLHQRNTPQFINVRKMSYMDTSFVVRPGEDNELVIPIYSKDYTLDTFVVRKGKHMQDTWLGRMFFSSKEKIQSINLAGYFVDKPYQVSLLPGIGTHGKMSSQVENNVSFNIFGGYTAGVHGVELGGLFNLVKNNVEGVQIGGLFNIAAGKIDGVQIAGLFNQTLDSLNGAQVAGLANFTGGSVTGAQIAGIYNHSKEDVASSQIAGVGNVSGGRIEGVQVGGVANIANAAVEGSQIAGVVNYAKGNVNGPQIAGVFNYAKTLRGLQVGLINYADSSSGVSIGLINFVRHGYHKMSVYTNEVVQLNAAFKSGNKKFYTIWLGGFNPGDDQQVASFGYGLGTEISVVKWFSVNPEITAQHLYLGDWNHTNILSRASVLLHFKPSKYLEIFAGPAYNIYYTEQTILHDGFMHIDPEKNYHATDFKGNTWGWIGWTAGVSIF